MKEMDRNLEGEIRRWQEKLFTRSVRRTQQRKHLEALIGNTHQLQCLEVSAGDGVLSTSFRSHGGSWSTVATAQEAADSVGIFLPETIALIEQDTFPFNNDTFDMVVLVDTLKDVEKDRAFIRECHRIIKPNGWVIISEERRRVVSVTAGVRALCGVSSARKGHRRSGYTDKELYTLLKEGFDVPSTLQYSNGWFESAMAVGEAVQKWMAPAPYWRVPKQTGQSDLYRYQKLYTLAGILFPFAWLLAKLDFLPGHKLLVKSRSRPWRTRDQPKLVDGRSIAEATINTKIGTAAPF